MAPDPSSTILVVRRLERGLQSDVGLFHLDGDGGETRAALLHAPRAADLEEALGVSLEAGITRCVVNLENFSWLDSAGLGVLVHAYTRCTDAGGGFALVRPNERVARMLRVAQMDDIFPIVASEDEAVARLRA